MVELTPEQCNALHGEPLPRIRNPQTDETYVLVRDIQYEGMRAILECIKRGAGWDDPNMDLPEQPRAHD